MTWEKMKGSEQRNRGPLLVVGKSFDRTMFLTFIGHNKATVTDIPQITHSTVTPWQAILHFVNSKANDYVTAGTDYNDVQWDYASMFLTVSDKGVLRRKDLMFEPRIQAPSVSRLRLATPEADQVILRDTKYLSFQATPFKVLLIQDDSEYMYHFLWSRCPINITTGTTRRPRSHYTLNELQQCIVPPHF